MLRGLGAKLLISLVLGALFAYVASRGGVPLLPPAQAFANVSWWAVPAYVCLNLASHVLRATRWRFLIAPVKHVPMRDVIALNFIGFFAILLLPLRLGEVVRPTLTKARQGIPISVGFGTVAVERVIDGLITSLCVAWALFALPRLPTTDPIATHLPKYGYAALTLFSCAFVALGMFLWQRKLAERLTHWGVGLVSRRLGALLAEKVDNVADGIRSIGDLRLGSAFVLESLLYWGANAVGVWVLGMGCGLPMELGHAVAVMGVLAIGILLPTGPGLFGNFQLAVGAALKLFFAAELLGGPGAVFVFLLYAVQSGVMVVCGLVPLYALRLRFSDLLRAPAAAS